MKNNQEILLNLCKISYIQDVQVFGIMSIQKELDKLIKDEQIKNSKHIFIQNRIKILNLFQELNYSDKDAHEFWYKAYSEQYNLKMLYNTKPDPVKKDNPNTYGEKFTGGGTVRQPKLCRKNAWKRFKKLFPDHKIKLN